MTEGSELEFRYGQEFSLLHIVQTGSGAHKTSYPMGTGEGTLSPGIKQQVGEADQRQPLRIGGATWSA
jgi:hypothetical protein